MYRSFKFASVVGAAVALASVCPSAHAFQCEGDPGWSLDLPDTVSIGNTVDIDMTGPANDVGLFMYSLGQGPTNIGKKWGDVCLDFPLAGSTYFLFDENGQATLSCEIDCDPDLVGITVYAQFITCKIKGKSNQDSITITDGCTVDDSISSNFNGTDIDPDNYIWFNSVVNVQNLATAPATVHFRGGKVTFSDGVTNYDLPLPDAAITISDTATAASTVFDPIANEWQTVVPSSYTGNIFMSGMGVQFPSGLPGGINPVVWSGTFDSDTSGVSFQWKWAAAVYTNFSDDPNALGVKPIDGNTLNPFNNSDHAGTPEAYKDDVTGGARGGGGSNFTGSYSGTSTAVCDCDC